MSCVWLDNDGVCPVYRIDLDDCLIEITLIHQAYHYYRLHINVDGCQREVDAYGTLTEVKSQAEKLANDIAISII